MTDQPTTVAPELPAEPAQALAVKVIPARMGHANGQPVHVPATVSVDGKPIARCEDEALAHLIAAVYQAGPEVVQQAADMAKQIADLDGLARDKQDQINDLTNQLGDAMRANERLRDMIQTYELGQQTDRETIAGQAAVIEELTAKLKEATDNLAEAGDLITRMNEQIATLSSPTAAPEPLGDSDAGPAVHDAPHQDAAGNQNPVTKATAEVVPVVEGPAEQIIGASPVLVGQPLRIDVPPRYPAPVNDAPTAADDHRDDGNEP